MKYINNSNREKTFPVHATGERVPYWVTLQPGQSKELPESDALRAGLTPVFIISETTEKTEEKESIDDVGVLENIVEVEEQETTDNEGDNIEDAEKNS